jgi:hypothetical protein
MYFRVRVAYFEDGFYKRLFDTRVICGGIYQITVSLNGKYTYDNIIIVLLID